MRGVLLQEPAWADRVWLGMPIGLRAALTLVEAGATSIEVVGGGLPSYARDARLTVAVTAYAGQPGPALLLRSDALVAPLLLRELGPGEAIASGDGLVLGARCELSAGSDPCQLLAGSAARAFVPDRYRFAVLLNSKEGLRVGRRALFGALIKPADGPVSRHLNRQISRVITALCVPLGMTPNQMTVLVLLCGVLGAFFACSDRAVDHLWGALLYQLHSVLDGCDGEIARLTKRAGKHGALIDSVVDDVCNGLFFLGLSIGVARTYDLSWPLLTAAITMLAHVPVAWLQLRVVLRQTGRGDKTQFWAVPRERFSLFALARIVTRRDTFVLLILLGVACGLSKVAVALFPVAAVGALLASVKRLRALEAEA